MASLPPLERGLRLLELVASSSEGVTYKKAHQYLDVSTSTVARLLKVLVQEEYLVQDNNLYKSGPALKRLSLGDNIEWLLAHNGNKLATELAELMHESCVVAVYNKEYFELTGVKIVENSISYAGVGAKAYHSRGNVLTMISHMMIHPLKAKEYFLQKGTFYDVSDNYPRWEAYVKSIVDGMKKGYFLELGWRRPHLYRIAIPVFSENANLAGAFFCGFNDYESLINNIEFFRDAILKTFSRIHNYPQIFDSGMEKLHMNLKLWEDELSTVESKI